MRLKLTSKVVAGLQTDTEAQILVYDTQLAGFGVRIGRHRKTYFAERRVNGKTRRASIERCDLMTCEQARRRAMKLLTEMQDGRDPAEERRLSTVRNLTLSSALEELIEMRPIAPSTQRLYHRTVHSAFRCWLDFRLVDISGEMVLGRFRELTVESGPGYANLAMRILRSVWNFARARYADDNGHFVVPINPVQIISDTRSWNRLKPRQSRISNSDLPLWHEAVCRLRDESPSSTAVTVSDYLTFLALTGTRRTEAANLMWACVDINERTFTLQNTKNGDALTLPMSIQIEELLSRRYATRNGKYVFPSRYPDRPLVDCRPYLQEVRIHSGVHFTLHDLRRTFLTLAEGLDVPHYALKRLVNHKTNGDVTAGYVVADPERLRTPMQLISDRITDLWNARDDQQQRER